MHLNLVDQAAPGSVDRSQNAAPLGRIIRNLRLPLVSLFKAVADEEGVLRIEGIVEPPDGLEDIVVDQVLGLIVEAVRVRLRAIDQREVGQGQNRID